MESINLEIRSNDTFREIFQSSAEGIIMVNTQGTILLTNPVTEKMFGYNEGELVGLNIDLLIPLTNRKNHTAHREHFSRTPSPRRMGMGRDLKAVRKDSTEFPVEISLSYKGTGPEMLIMAFIIDISERKKNEEALKQSEEQLLIYAAELEKKVLMRTEALNQTIVELEKEIDVRKKAEEEVRVSLSKERELNEMKSKFVSIASHEFRTPLSTILSSASLILQYMAKQEENKVEKHIHRIKSNVNHLTAILNDFLNLGKLEEGRIETTSEYFVVEDFLREIQEELKPMLKPEQRFTLQLPELNEAVYTDARILKNILINLLTNAIKYTDPGKQIFLKAIQTKEDLTFDVIDQGIGIPEEDKRHLFERFFRASNATNIQGTGLGLNIVRRYVELLNGKIYFESEYGKGSTFTVKIPL